MKNAIRILLYALLVLLVGAIAYMIYKRAQSPVDELPPTTEMADSLFMDPGITGSALTKEDSMILDLTGQLPSHVGAPAGIEESPEIKPATQSTTPATGIDYTQDSGSNTPTNEVNSKPTAQKVSNTTSNKSTASTAKKAETKTASKAKTKATPKASFYVVSGSFIKPDNADDQVKKLKKMGYKDAKRNVFGSSEYYSAVVGLYHSREEANKVIEKLSKKGEKAFLKAK